MQKNEVALGPVIEVIMGMGTKSIMGIEMGKETEKATKVEIETPEAALKISSNVLEFVTANMRHRFVSALESIIPKDVINKSMTDFAYSSVLDDCDIPHDLLKLIEKENVTTCKIIKKL